MTLVDQKLLVDFSTFKNAHWVNFHTPHIDVFVQDAKMSRTSQDHDIAKQLWNRSVKLVQLKPEEIEL